MAKLVLTDLANLSNENTAVAAVNANNTAIETALENTLSRDGTSPNTMSSTLDMNSNRIINLPPPGGPTDPARFQDLASAAGINSGTMALQNANSVAISGGTITGVAITSSTLATCTGLPVATGISGLGTGVATFLATPTSANLISCVTDETGTGNLLFSTTPTITRPNIVGVIDASSAAAGSVGEYIESVILQASATSLVTATPKTITSISLTAGDWDVSGVVYYLFPTSTTVTLIAGSISTTTNVSDTTSGRWSQLLFASFAPGNGTVMSQVIPTVRINVSSTTTYYLVAAATFATSTLTGFGAISARRRR